jgi:hypothetical protein
VVSKIQSPIIYLTEIILINDIEYKSRIILERSILNKSYVGEGSYRYRIIGNEARKTSDLIKERLF